MLSIRNILNFHQWDAKNLIPSQSTEPGFHSQLPPLRKLIFSPTWSLNLDCPCHPGAGAWALRPPPPSGSPLPCHRQSRACACTTLAVHPTFWNIFNCLQPTIFHSFKMNFFTGQLAELTALHCCMPLGLWTNRALSTGFRFHKGDSGYIFTIRPRWGVKMGGTIR